MRTAHWGKTVTFLLFFLTTFIAKPVLATTIRSVKLAALFDEADRVLLVKIVSGDSEHYESPVYKAVVQDAYKGAKRGDTIFFGRFEGYAIGTQYILFLRSGHAEEPKENSGLSYGTIEHVDEIMYAGYSALAVGYECVFDGAQNDRQCDDSVQLNPEQIVIPRTMKAFPTGDATGDHQL